MSILVQGPRACSAAARAPAWRQRPCPACGGRKNRVVATRFSEDEARSHLAWAGRGCMSSFMTKKLDIPVPARDHAVMASRRQPTTNPHRVAAVVRQRIADGGERLWRLEDFRDLPFAAVAQALSGWPKPVRSSGSAKASTTGLGRRLSARAGPTPLRSRSSRRVARPYFRRALQRPICWASRPRVPGDGNWPRALQVCRASSSVRKQLCMPGVPRPGPSSPRQMPRYSIFSGARDTRANSRRRRRSVGRWHC